tara:strand:- start:571 stop:1071 length:501 start_codon:yes stop_codon:yes gene_type:complete
MKKLLGIVVLGLLLTFKANADEKIKLICTNSESEIVEFKFNLNTAKMTFPNISAGKGLFYYNEDYFYWISDLRSWNQETVNFGRTRISRLTGLLTQNLYNLNEQQFTDWDMEWPGFLQDYQLKNVAQTGKIDSGKNIFTYAKYHALDQFKIFNTYTMNCKKSKNIF